MSSFNSQPFGFTKFFNNQEELIPNYYIKINLDQSNGPFQSIAAMCSSETYISLSESMNDSSKYIKLKIQRRMENNIKFEFHMIRKESIIHIEAHKTSPPQPPCTGAPEAIALESDKIVLNSILFHVPYESKPVFSF
jgi:hypothetical protein